MRKKIRYIVCFKNDSGTGLEWETPGDPNVCSFETLEKAKKAIKELIDSDPETWGNTEWKIEVEI